MDSQRKVVFSSKISPGKVPTTHAPSVSNQGLATLVVMICVLTIIIMFCCFAAPGVRDLCRRYIFRTCVIDDPERDNASTAAESATPTIILLPYGRMLVVDRTVFAQLQADHTGIDFMELSANLIRAQRLQTGSTPSILDSEATSKGLSPTSLGFSPPAYDEIFGDKTSSSDLPPSYSEISLMFRTHHQNYRQATSITTTNELTNNSHQNIELCIMNNNGCEPAGNNILNSSVASAAIIEANNENNLNKEIDDEEHVASTESRSVHIVIPCNDPSTSENYDNPRCISTVNIDECPVRRSSK